MIFIEQLLLVSAKSLAFINLTDAHYSFVKNSLPLF